ncbi:MAG: Eco57I restriction-modification methylase domain-containing protein [Candidatus Helarchaeota archaeon]
MSDLERDLEQLSEIISMIARENINNPAIDRKQRHFVTWKNCYFTVHSSNIPDIELIDFFSAESARVLLAYLLFIKKNAELFHVEWSAFKFNTNSFRAMADRVKKQLLPNFIELTFYFWSWLNPHEENSILDDCERQLSSVLLRIFSSYSDEEINKIFETPVGRLPSQKQKDKGEFYTEMGIVDFILDEIGYTTRLHDKRILDPACGTGNFIVKALQRYINDSLQVVQARSYLQILENLLNVPHVVGMDIDLFACCMSKLRFLHVINDLVLEAKKRNDSFVIKSIPIYFTDSLIPDDFEEDGLKKTEDYLILESLKSTQAWDFVVGNPPYIRATRFRSSKRSKYRKIFPNIASGAFDISILFLFKGVEWLKEKGKLGFIITNKFFINKYAEPLRAHLLRETNILTIVDLTSSDVFENRYVSTTIFIAEKTRRPMNEVRIIRVKNKSPEAIHELMMLRTKKFPFSSNELQCHVKEQSEWERIPGNVFQIFNDYNLKNIIRKIQGDGTLKLKQIGKIHGGIMGFNYHSLRPLVTDEKLGKNQLKLLTPGLIRHFRVLWGKKSMKLFRRKETGDEPVKYKTPFLRIDSSLISDNTASVFRKRKILIRSVARELTSFLDEKGEYAYAVAIFALHDLKIPVQTRDLLTEKNDDDNINGFQHYCVALLNSSLLDFYHKFNHALGRIPKGSYRYTKEMLQDLPIKIPANQSELEIYNKIRKLCQEIHESNQDLEKVEGDINFNKKELDNLIKMMYGITADEWNGIESFLKMK